MTTTAEDYTGHDWIDDTTETRNKNLDARLRKPPPLLGLPVFHAIITLFATPIKAKSHSTTWRYDLYCWDELGDAWEGDLRVSSSGRIR